MVSIVGFVGVVAVQAQHLSLPANSIPLSAPAGQELLLSSHERAAYWPLSIRYVTQVGLSHCGPASAVMVLNALGIPAPAGTDHAPYHEFDQDNFFTPATEKILPRQRLYHMGATLDELAAMVAAHGVAVEAHHASSGGLDEFRRLARQAVNSTDTFIIASFDRTPLPQEGGTHFSPLAAYNESTDRFLVMDVARFHYPPWWVTAEALFKGMSTLDATAGKNRGFLIIKGPRKG
jgi:hypothetical protein